MSRDPLVMGNIVGDVVDPFIKSASLRIIYNNKEVINRSELKSSMVASEPRVEIRGCDLRTLYTLHFTGNSLFRQKLTFGGFGSTPNQSCPFGSTFQQTQSTFGSIPFDSTTFSASSQPAFGASSTQAFDSSSAPAFGAASTPAFGATSTPAFGSTSTSAFSSTPTPLFCNTGTSFKVSFAPAFGSTATPAFGSQSASLFGSSVTLAFGAASTPAFGSSSTLAFGASSNPSFSFGSIPSPGQTAFGGANFSGQPTSSPAPAQANPFGQPAANPAQANPFGSTSIFVCYEKESSRDLGMQGLWKGQG